MSLLLQQHAQWSLSRGPRYGIRQQTLQTALLLRLPACPDWNALQQRQQQILPGLHACELDTTTPLPERQACQLLLHWAQSIQQLCGLAVFSPPQILSLQPMPDGSLAARIALPCPSASAGRQALQWALDCLQGLLAEGEDSLLQSVTRDCRKQLEPLAPTGTNSRRFLQAAHELQIPWQPLAGNVYQIGQGARSRWLDSSFTDHTSAIGSQLARNKRMTASVLRAAGLPAPPHRQVGSAEQAVEEAERMGYPLVIKPMDCERGNGVSPGLQNAEQVRAAFLRASEYSKRILLERHVEGRDYRLTVLEGQLLWAIERVPGGVEGDGRQSITELLHQLNDDPRRSHRHGAPLKPVELDDEAADMLQQAGLQADSVPAAGQFVRLRRTANVSSGGMPVAMLEQVHPDNRRLAERAAAALRLDLAGIDLLIPDIRRSWQESGAAICEVNAQPQLGATTGPHLYGQILQHLLQGDGRIPVTLVLTDQIDGPRDCIEALRLHWKAAGKRCGLRTARGVWLDGERLSPPLDLIDSGRILLGNQSCDALILQTTMHEVLQHGLPFDQCDQLILAFNPLQLKAAEAREVISLLQPHSRSLLYASKHSGWQQFGAGPSVATCSRQQLGSAAVEWWQGQAGA